MLKKENLYQERPGPPWEGSRDWTSHQDQLGKPMGEINRCFLCGSGPSWILNKGLSPPFPLSTFTFSFLQLVTEWIVSAKFIYCNPYSPIWMDLEIVFKDIVKVKRGYWGRLWVNQTGVLLPSLPNCTQLKEWARKQGNLLHVLTPLAAIKNAGEQQSQDHFFA